MSHALGCTTGREIGREAGWPKARAALAAVLWLAVCAAQPALAAQLDPAGPAGPVAPATRPAAPPLDAPPPLPPADRAGTSAPAAPAAPTAPGSPSVPSPVPSAAPPPGQVGASPGNGGGAITAAGAGPALPDDAVDDPIPPARQTSPEPQIEQVHNGRRVAEVIVVPAGTNLHYTLVNRESQRPSTSSPLNTTSNLSTQRFFRVDF